MNGSQSQSFFLRPYVRTYQVLLQQLCDGGSDFQNLKPDTALAVKEILTDAHKQAFSVGLRQKHVDKSVDFWKTVIFSDEKTFSSYPNVPVTVYRPRNSRFDPMYVKERGRSGRFSVHDNSRVHTCKEAKNWFFEKRIQQLSWPVRSPDLNPIENIWGIMVREMKKEDCPLKANKLLEDIEDAWESIGAPVCNRVIQSMTERLRLVIKNSGGRIDC
ncbi:hypothetical protein J437_LFUL007948 [Ladona fulva]|uniref:Tc1-like transposase DDE domain-containing protein n=1 Tax=Ladona fulva TaxID=123851 RepID=A0A8K0KCQ8_LADFU|nr:hypothetical protein J437_LFUL007948 [Ladona fulva]